MYRISFFLLLFISISCNTTQEVQNLEEENVIVLADESIDTPLPKTKNIILMIGDGMGLSQITAGIYSNGNYLALEEFNSIGLHKPYSSDNLITDSAAGATAFACGQKTYNGAIAVDDNKQPIKTILEEAEENGMKTGLVATSTIVHATPASFYAHNEYRKNYDDIAADFLETDVDIFIGGGLNYFNKREDNRDITKELEAKGYYMSDYFQEDLTDLDISNKNKVGYLTSASDPLKADQGRDYLPLATKKSLDFLENRSDQKGFFLMIEGSQIDWGGHANDGDYVVSEMKDFNKAIEVVLEYSKNHPETLVIITADHETGGLALNPGSKMDSLSYAFTSGYHTADIIPVFAKGPGEHMFRGIYQNTDIYHKMRKAFGWNEMK